MFRFQTDLDFRLDDIDDLYIELFVYCYMNIDVCVCLFVCVCDKIYIYILWKKLLLIL